MFRFGAPQWLPALLLVPVLAVGYWVAARRRRQALIRFADAALVRRLTASVSVRARRTKVVLRLTAVGLVAFALARPQFGTRVETVKSVGQDVLVALDLSNSMLAQDVSPSRLQRAKLAVLRLIGKLDGDRIGLVAFAEQAYVQSPLTIDYTAATMFLDAMEPSLMPVQGTDLAEALRVSLDALEHGARQSRVLLVVTDGEDHEGNVDAQLERAKKDDVVINTVGIGSEEGAPIPVLDEKGNRSGFLRDADGNVVTTKLDEAILRHVADETGGTYVRAGVGGTAFDDLIDGIAGGTGEALDARRLTQFEEQYQIFLGLALALLLAEALLPERKRVQEGETIDA